MHDTEMVHLGRSGAAASVAMQLPMLGGVTLTGVKRHERNVAEAVALAVTSQSKSLVVP